MNDWTPSDAATALRAKEAEVRSELRNREGLAAEAEAETGDLIQRAADRAIVIQALDRNSALLREVEAALERIEQGAYGHCLACGEPISPKRLAAVPWAALCLVCQEQADREGAHNPAEFELTIVGRGSA